MLKGSAEGKTFAINHSRQPYLSPPELARVFAGVSRVRKCTAGGNVTRRVRLRWEMCALRPYPVAKPAARSKMTTMLDII